MKVTDIRLSVIAGEGKSATEGGKHVAVHISNAQEAGQAFRSPLFSNLLEFCSDVLEAEDDATKVEISVKDGKLLITPEESAETLEDALDQTASPDSKLVDEVKSQYKTIADLQAQLADAKKDSEAKAKTIADLQTQVAQLTPKS